MTMCSTSVTNGAYFDNRDIFFSRQKNIYETNDSAKRMTCGQERFLSFSTSFLPSIFASTVHDWTHIQGIQRRDVLTYDALFIPFSADERTTLFVVIGAGNIHQYQRKNFTGNRPCILEFNPYVDEVSRHHLPSVTSKIYAWLNKMYREDTGGDYLTNPYHKRSMPLCSPFGKSKENFRLPSMQTFHASPHLQDCQRKRLLPTATGGYAFWNASTV